MSRLYFKEKENKGTNFLLFFIFYSILKIKNNVIALLKGDADCDALFLNLIFHSYILYSAYQMSRRFPCQMQYILFSESMCPYTKLYY